MKRTITPLGKNERIVSMRLLEPIPDFFVDSKGVASDRLLDAARASDAHCSPDNFHYQKLNKIYAQQ